MNHTFLEYVAKDLLKKYGTNMSNIAVIFPNKRASLFLNDCLARQAQSPIWAPSYYTISNLFRRHSSLTVADSIKLICDLHKSFTACTGIDESIDHFYGWGQLLLADFDDIDKNLADAEKVFRNIENLHELDDISYLTQEQRQILKRFFANFSEDDSELKKRFISLWKHFSAIYNHFNQHLTSQGLAYEGAMYRAVATDKDISFPYETYIFIGFNFLHSVEKKLFMTLKKQGKARFYWDYDQYYMPHKDQPENEAGHFIAQYIDVFPNEFDNGNDNLYNNLSKIKDIHYVSASTDTIQTTYLTRWLSEKGRIPAGKKTAVVMCDESILQNVIHALPDEMDKANITIGFPLQQTAVMSFVYHLIMLQTKGYNPTSGTFYLVYALKVLLHPYTILLSPQSEIVARKIKERKLFIINIDDLHTDEILKDIFTPIPQFISRSSSNVNQKIFEWVLHILTLLGTKVHNDDALFTESVFRMYTLINRLVGLMENGDLNADLSTLLRLFSQLVSSTTIPFHGEPIEGVQIMGVLETRNLDFEHLLILSCNEGKLPKSVNDASFIPYSIRKAYGLTTIDHKMAIYAYYFNRLIQRSHDITIVYTTGTDDMKSGEMSRFMMQYMVESNITVHHYTLQAEHSTCEQEPVTIKKTPGIMQALYSLKKISPTAINRYLRCPLSFYYCHIAHIHEYIEEEKLDMDNRTFGNIFHKVCETLYHSMSDDKGYIHASVIEKVVRNQHLIEHAVDEAFKEELFKNLDNRRQPEYNGMQIINRAVIIRYVNNLLEMDKKNAPFRILGLEIPVFGTYDLHVNGIKHSIEVGGYIDRLDVITDSQTRQETIRVVDYKTGKEATRAMKSVDDVFARNDIAATHANYYLQAMLYAINVANTIALNAQHLPVSPALLFIQHLQRNDYDPVLTFKKDKTEHRLTDILEYKERFCTQLQHVLEEVFNTKQPFVKTNDNRNCTFCPYRELCKIDNY